MTTALAPRTTAAASLGALAERHATGVLIGATGTVYLAEGRVVHAESPAAPDLGALLTRSAAVDPDGWQDALDRAGARRGVGRHLVDSGRLAAGALELCHLGALFDAAYFVLGPEGPEPRFRPGAAHWIGAVRPVPVDVLVRECARRRALLDRIWPRPDVDGAPLARVTGGRARARTLPGRRRRILAEIDGERTAAQIASALGCRTFHTLVELRRLAADGLVTPVPRRAAPQAPPADRLPPPVDDPDTALLRRLRDALEAL
ncbi:hypothetical protein [Streptomyces sp. B93]|uniref:hypothetical protein n=1 Tax=Streptomyces sp. B93 TaxID=2824875 RepID=UPI001B38AF3B|nr:hypothetical protein [Streptomyces sp. B93]MBQ1088288.1 hypothetical protein [Streptomyces sp. B93]